MGPGPDDKYLEESGYLTPRRATPTLALPGPVKMASQFVPPFAIGLLMLLIVGGLVFVGHARVTDDLHTAEHRNRLRNAIEFMHLAPQNGVVDAATIQQLENLSGVGKLQWENDPDERGREIQMVQDANGRILGWFSWDPDHAIMDVAIRFLPLWGLVAAGLLMLAALSLWYVRALARELEAANERTRQVARQDPISGLPEAAATLETLEHMLARREPGEFVTLCYMDLTGFRELADTYGRPWSNELVRVAADRLRELEWPQSVLGRLGRHRFIILVCAKNSEAGLRMAQQVANLIAKPLHVHGQILNLAANIGLAQAPRDGLTSDELFRHATLAMREAKRVGSAGIVEFDPSMEADLSERRFIERELKRALDEDALEVHYQPIVTAEDSRIVGIEALLRWTHPTRGNIPPMVFVPVAEQCGLMTRLGEYVLYRAFNDAKRWPDLFLAVNLSPIQVKDRALLTIVAAMLDETGLDPKRLVLEITEGVLIDDHEEACERLEEIRQLGVRIALDDFGSGYSSLSYLQSFPFDKLKIDGSFVAHLGKLENSAFIIHAIVALGRALNLSVLAEGVETEDQRTLLRIAGCDEMQGYLFARPVPRPGIDALLTDSKLHAARTGQSAQAS